MKKKIIFLSISTIFFAFSVFSFFRFANVRQVSLEYKMYYIDHELNYYLEDNGFKNLYSVGTKCNYCVGGNYRNQGSGWDKVNKNSTKTSSRITNIYYFVNNEEHDLTFNIDIEEKQSTSFDLYVNDLKTDYTLDISTKLSYSLSLSNSLFRKNSLNKISLHNNSDTLFCVKSVELL